MFSLTDPIEFQPGKWASVQNIMTTIFPLLTPERQQKILNVTKERCFDVSVVLENIYDRGNTSAVMRTGEGLGFANFHVIETFEKFKESNRVTQGADKWIEVKKWKSTSAVIDYFKKNKIRICVTSLEAAKPIHEIDFTSPIALVLGNEKSGISQEMSDAADERVIIPMPGFVQSFNISVAGALCLYQIYQNRLQKLGKNADVSEKQMQILNAHYALRTLDSAADILKNKLDL